MELGDLEMNGSVSGDQKAIEEHCETIAILKCSIVLKKTSNAHRFAIRKTLTIDNRHAGRRKV